MNAQTRIMLDKIKEQLTNTSDRLLFEDDALIKEQYYGQLVSMKEDGVIKDFHLDWNGRVGTVMLKLADAPEFIELTMEYTPVSKE